MKILQINTVYDKGSTGKIVYDIKSELDFLNVENFVIFGRGVSHYDTDCNVLKPTKELESNMSHFLSYVNGNLYGLNIFNTHKIINKIKQIKPDIVHLHCLNGFYVNICTLIKFLKNNHYKTILTLHADFMFTGTCGYSYECHKYNESCGSCPNIQLIEKHFLLDNTHANNMSFTKAFNGFKNLKVVSVSPYLMEKASSSKILKDFSHYCVLNGLDTKIFSYDNSNAAKKIFNDKKVILHVTSNFNFPEKGGMDFLKLAEMNLHKNDLLFVIVGDGKYNGTIPENVIFYGRTNNQNELASLYSYASITVIPSRCETFSMVAAESLSCGTPIIGYYAGGPETIAIDKYSSFCNFQDVESLNKLMHEQLNKKISKISVCKLAHKKYSKEIMAKAYIDIYKSFN